MDQVFHAVVFVAYLAFMLGVGIYFYKRTKNEKDYFLGGRNMNFWVTAMSAQASDMSGWLLMGLPGTAFLLTKNNGIAEAFWTALGLFLGTYLNWLLLAKRLRNYSEKADNAITISAYLENRFQDRGHWIRMISAVFIVIFFLVYTAAQFSAGAKLFNAVFGLNYYAALLVGAIVIVSYTFLGGYKAVCWTDLFQGILMLFAIVLLPILAVTRMGGFSETFDLAASLSGLPEGLGIEAWTGIGMGYGGLTIISTMAWGLGYFGQPHILTRFMGIRSAKEIRPARRLAMGWVFISLCAAVLLGIIGRAYVSTIMSGEEVAALDGEKIFIYLTQSLLKGPGLAILAGILLSAILAAIMSTADSQLLVSSAAVSEDIAKTLFGKRMKSQHGVLISRLTVLGISAIALLLAADPESSVFDLVSYAWAGFGAAFGPAILLSLYWKRMNRQGALAGILSGGISVLLWKNWIHTYLPIYELLPAFLISVLCIVVVSLVTPAPEKDVETMFNAFIKEEKA